MKQGSAGRGLGGALAILGMASGCEVADEAELALTFEPPAGSGLAPGELEVESILPVIFQDFSLSAGLPVTGQVTDGSGTPLPNAEVSFLSSLTGARLDEAVADATGQYSVELAPGTYDVVVESGAPGLGDLRFPGIEVTGAAQDFQFPAPVGLTGSVFEDLGPSIPGALLEFTGSQTGAFVSVTADAFGDFSAGLVPDLYEVVVTPAGGTAATHLKERFTTPIAAGTNPTDFTLTEGVAVSGTLLDELGSALLEDSLVQAVLPDGSPFFPPPDAVASAADGTYSIGPVPPGEVCFVIKPPGDSGFPVQGFVTSVLAGGAQAEDFSLLAGFVLSGTVYQEGGLAPEELVDVLPVALGGGLLPLNAVTDPGGFYAVSVFPGMYDVTFTPELTNLQLPELHTLNITGDTPFDLDLTTGARLTGTVTEPGGVLPAEDVLVSIPGALGAQGVTDAAGVYSFLAPLGTHTLALQALDGSFEHFALADVSGVAVAGPTNLDLELAFELFGSTVVQGRVTDSNGTPVGGAIITATDRPSSNVVGRSLSGPGGDYLLVVP